MYVVDPNPVTLQPGPIHEDWNPPRSNYLEGNLSDSDFFGFWVAPSSFVNPFSKVKHKKGMKQL